MREYDKVLRDHVALVTKAADFAARRHLGQVRKGTAREPYLNHLAEVAGLLAESVNEPNAWLVAAGWLHDTIEDTKTTAEEIRAVFGDFVANIVLEVTDDKSLPKAERKRRQILNTPGKSDNAKLLKLADKISNLRALATSPPVDWDHDRCQDYISWAEAVVTSARALNARLENQFDAAAKAAKSTLSTRQSALPKSA